MNKYGDIIDSCFEAFWNALVDSNGLIKLLASIISDPKKMMKLSYMQALDVAGRIQSRLVLKEAIETISANTALMDEMDDGEVICINAYWDRSRSAINPDRQVLFSIHVNGKENFDQISLEEINTMINMLNNVKIGIRYMAKEKIDYNIKVSEEIDSLIQSISVGDKNGKNNGTSGK